MNAYRLLKDQDELLFFYSQESIEERRREKKNTDKEINRQMT
mgnify:CR=1 FL=1